MHPHDLLPYPHARVGVHMRTRTGAACAGARTR
jgi:hypothetical protein